MFDCANKISNTKDFLPSDSRQFTTGFSGQVVCVLKATIKGEISQPAVQQQLNDREAKRQDGRGLL